LLDTSPLESSTLSGFFHFIKIIENIDIFFKMFGWEKSKVYRVS
jgi:hypothetical protein